jgi:hypothetical protein
LFCSREEIGVAPKRARSKRSDLAWHQAYGSFGVQPLSRAASAADLVDRWPNPHAALRFRANIAN